MKDTMLSDGLTDAFNDYHMGITGTILLNLDDSQTFSHESCL